MLNRRRFNIPNWNKNETSILILIFDLRNEMKDHAISLNKHCPCSQLECPIRGNCVLCVQNHLEHKRHIPECIQNILRPQIESLFKQLELTPTESRATLDFWKRLNKDKFLKESIARHRNPNEEFNKNNNNDKQ